jgi:ribosomal protein S19E (S16A)
MLIVTGVYLIAELSFNATLLDVTGTLASSETIEKAEFFGRLLSSIAVVLALLGFLVKEAIGRSWAKWNLILIVLMLCIPLGLGVFFGEKALVDHLVYKSTAKVRQNAAILIVLRQGLLESSIRVSGIDLTADKLKTPEGKTFSALLPFLGFNASNLRDKVRPALGKLCIEACEKNLPSAERLFDETYLAGIGKIKSAYNDRYVQGSNAYLKAVNDIPSLQKKYWDKYLKQLKRKGYRPTNVPRSYYTRIAQMVRNEGIPVSKGWHPYQKNTFYSVVAGKIKSNASKSFHAAIERSLEKNAKLEPGLQWTEFYKSKAIQSKFKKELSPIFDNWITVPEDLSKKEFLAQVYRPLINGQAASLLGSLVGDGSSFSDGGKNELLGRNSYRVSVVPPLALFFSLIGAIVHIAKFINFLLTPLVQIGCIRGVFVFLTITFSVWFPTTQKNIITSSNTYEGLIRYSGENIRIVPILTTWVIKSQVYIYPVNSKIRDTIFGNAIYRIVK